MSLNDPVAFCAIFLLFFSSSLVFDAQLNDEHQQHLQILQIVHFSCFNTLVFGLFFNMPYDRFVDVALRSRAIAFQTIHIEFVAKMCTVCCFSKMHFFQQKKNERRTTLKSVSTEWRSIHFSQTITLKWNNLPFLIRTSCFVQTLIN